MSDKSRHKSKIKNKFEKIKDIEGKFDMGNAACSGDCTGLIQVEPLNDEQLDSYLEIYDFMPCDIDN